MYQPYESARQAPGFLRFPVELRALERLHEKFARGVAELEKLRSVVPARKLEKLEEQIRLGDTTYIPLHTREDSINQGMYSYRAQVFEHDRKDFFNPPVIAIPNTNKTEIEDKRTSLASTIVIQSTTKQTRLIERDVHEQKTHQAMRLNEQRTQDEHALDDD